MHLNLGRAYELRFHRGRRYVTSQRRWVAPEGDRQKAAEAFQRCIALGGPYAQQAREALSLLEWSKSPREWRTAVRLVSGAASRRWPCASQTAPAAQRPSRPNVLLVTLDTTRADRIGAYGYTLADTPTLDRLAREGVRFDDATTQSPLTAPGACGDPHGAVSRAAGDHATTPARRFPSRPTTLAESLRGVRLPHRRVHRRVRRRSRLRLRAGVRHLRRRRSRASGRRSRGRCSGRRKRSSIRRSHSSRRRRRPRRSSRGSTSTIRTRRTIAPPPYGAKFAGRPYDGEIAYVDAQIGRMLARSSGRAQRDRTIVVGRSPTTARRSAITARRSTGSSSTRRSRACPGSCGCRTPSGRARSSRNRCRSVDLTPTVLELAGARARTRAPTARASRR